MNTEDFSLKDFEDWLNSFLNFEKTPEKNIFWLDTMNFIASEFGNPQESFKIVHVAGSKGKGSVSSYISNILTEDGKKTGLYTSPHILTFFERISLAGKLFPEESYLKAAKEMLAKKEIFTSEKLPEKRKVTWFELVTLYAFLVFRQEKCEWVVLETGLGGRLDATNICKPEFCVITPIELEHTEYLGDTIGKIAGEKAGIIKEQTPVFISRQKAEARVVFEKIASEKNAPVYFLDEKLKTMDLIIKKNEFRFSAKFKDEDCELQDIKLRMPGKIQAENAAIASYALMKNRILNSDNCIKQGIETTKLPARFEIVELENIHLVFDGAHTENSIKLTLDTYKKLYRKSKIVLFACAKDKNMTKMSELILKYGFNNIILTKPGEKATDMTILEKCFLENKRKLNFFRRNKIELSVIENAELAFKKAVLLGKQNNQSVLICGSFYLASEIKRNHSAGF